MSKWGACRGIHQSDASVTDFEWRAGDGRMNICETFSGRGVRGKNDLAATVELVAGLSAQSSQGQGRTLRWLRPGSHGPVHGIVGPLFLNPVVTAWLGTARAVIL